MSTSINDRIAESFARHEKQVLDLSHTINDHPEVAFHEHDTAACILKVLETDGRFAVQAPVAGLDTAFIASVGHGSLSIGLCAELDALPGIGHGCAHNVISASSVGAVLALADVADELDLTIRLLGTPAEEVLTGKTIMLERGAFDGLHAAMMMHPTLKDMATPRIRAVRHWSISYIGRTAHASRPFNALNASDAATIAQVAVAMLRQQMRDTDRVHVWNREVGAAVNVIAGHATVECMIRADHLDEVDALWHRVRRCFEAGALASGVDLAVKQLSAVNGFHHDLDLAASFQRNAEALGRTFPDYADKYLGSTDMAEVSVHMPAIHPVLSFDAPPEDGNHTTAFARLAGGPEGDRAVRDGGLALAWTVADAATDSTVRERLLRAGPFHWTTSQDELGASS